MREQKFLVGTTHGKDFRLPVSFTTQTCAVLARKGAGKTYTSQVLAEGLLGLRQQVVVIDPLNAWWGLRSSSAGKTSMFEVVIFGGEYGDMPLERDMGAAIAKLVAENPSLSCVLSLRHMRKGDQYKFVTDFSETLFHIKGHSKYATPVHLFMDEADRFCPQRMWQGSERMVGAVEDIVLRGRQAGLGVTMITQRSARINKNVLTQVEMLVVGQITGPQDKKSIKEWIELNADIDRQKEFLESLAKLKRGNLWFWSPSWLGCMSNVDVKKKLTFDSSATPKPGAKVKTPKKRAPVDLKKIREVLADTVKKIEADDPKKLKAEIAKLKKELQKKTVDHKETIDVIKMLGLFNKAASEKYSGKVRLAVNAINKKDAMSPAVDIVMNQLKSDVAEPLTMDEVKRGRSLPPKGWPTAKPRARKIVKSEANTKPAPVLAIVDNPDEYKLGRCEQKIINVLASRGNAASKKTVALHAGYSPKSGGFNNSLSRLRQHTLIVSNGSGMLSITNSGMQLADASDPVADIDFWKSHRSVGKCGSKILGVLEHRGGPMTKQEIADESGYVASSGGFNNSLSRLRTLGLIEGRGEISLSEELLGAY